MSNKATNRVKRGMAEMPKGGIIMAVINGEQAKIAEESGAVAVMALEKVPADEEYHLLKNRFTIPVVCGCRDLGEASRRIAEGASMLRTKGEPGTGNIVEAVRHIWKVNAQIRKITNMNEDELMTEAKNLRAPFELLLQVKREGRLPVVNFAAGGIATPADAALMMQLSADGVFVGSGIFKSENPVKFARSIVEATTHYQDYELIAALSKGLGTAMKGIEISTILPEHRMQEHGW